MFICAKKFISVNSAFQLCAYTSCALCGQKGLAFHICNKRKINYYATYGENWVSLSGTKIPLHSVRIQKLVFYSICIYRQNYKKIYKTNFCVQRAIVLWFCHLVDSFTSFFCTRPRTARLFIMFIINTESNRKINRIYFILENAAHERKVKCVL